MDWGDALLNEGARPQTWPLPPSVPVGTSAAVTFWTAVAIVVRSAGVGEPGLSTHDHGVRILPIEGGS